MARERRARAAPADLALVLSRSFPAPQDKVFAAWTDPKLLAQWWGPKGFSTPLCDMDVRPGGRWRTCMRSPEGKEHWVSGVYREIAPPERLVFTWAWEDPPGQRGDETVVQLEFRARGKATEVTLRQEVFASKGSRDQHNQGWTSSFDSLAEFLDRDANGPND